MILRSFTSNMGSRARIRILLAGMVLSSLACVGQSTPGATPPSAPHATINTTSDGRRYVTSDWVGISILLPPDWRIAREEPPSPGKPSTVILNLPQTFATVELNHMVFESSAELFQKTMELGFEKISDSFQKISEASVQRDGREGSRMQCLVTRRGIRSKVMMELFTDGKDHWMISASASDEVFEKYRDLFDRMLQSVRFTALAAAPAGKDAAADAFSSGQYAFNHGDLAEARSQLERAAKLAPASATAWILLGRTYLRLDDNLRAEEAFRKVIQLKPQDEWGYNNLGVALMNQDKLDEAKQSFQKQIEIAPKESLAYRNLGRLFLKQGNYPEATKNMEMAAELDPKTAETQTLLGDVYLAQSQDQKALSAYRNAVSLSPRPGTWNEIAYKLALRGTELPLAEQYVTSAIAVENAEVLTSPIDRLGERDLAKTESMADYWDTLGWVYFRQDKLQDAERFIRAAWLLNRNAVLADHLGQVEEKLGKTADASQSYAYALAMGRDKTLEDEFKPDEVRQRLVKLTGNEKAAASAIEKAKADLVALGSSPLAYSPAEEWERSFLVSLRPGPMVEQVSPISPSDVPPQAMEALKQAHYPIAFPDAAQTRLNLEVRVNCPGQKKDCRLKVLTPHEAWRKEVSSPLINTTQGQGK